MIVEKQLDYSMAAPGSTQAMYKLHKYLEESGLKHLLLELVKSRVPQANGCTHCLDTQAKDARSFGESAQYL